jgi:N-dimethylarginine dimethylaminohydrolase
VVERTATFPNLIFMRDLFLMTPEGVLLGRPASTVRAGEERWAQLGLARAGVPLVGAIRGVGSFEVADALWVDRISCWSV